MISQAPVVMECSVEDIYETKGFENFICTIDATYAEESVLNEDGKIDYHTLKPVLFEMPTYEYLLTGEVIGKCMSFFAVFGLCDGVFTGYRIDCKHGSINLLKR